MPKVNPDIMQQSLKNHCFDESVQWGFLSAKSKQILYIAMYGLFYSWVFSLLHKIQEGMKYGCLKREHHINKGR